MLDVNSPLTLQRKLYQIILTFWKPSKTQHPAIAYLTMLMTLKKILLLLKMDMIPKLTFFQIWMMMLPLSGVKEVQNEGSQLSLKLTCINNCEYLWQLQPPLPNIKGAGNLLFTAGIFFCDIPFSKFAALSKLINLKFIGKGTIFQH